MTWACRISVCHFPPGTSKWNKIEHRLFCHITQNWRGRPLRSRAIVVNLIGHTTTKAGLRVQAELDTGAYRKGIKVSDEELAADPPGEGLISRRVELYYYTKSLRLYV